MGWWFGSGFGCRGMFGLNSSGMVEVGVCVWIFMIVSCGCLGV